MNERQEVVETLDFAEVVLLAPAELIRQADLLAAYQMRRLNTVIVEALERYVAKELGYILAIHRDPQLNAAITAAMERYVISEINRPDQETSSPNL